MNTDDRYHFLDNWYGTVLTFRTLRAAKKAAAKQSGLAVTIHDTKTGKMITVKASGIVYP